MKYFSTPLVALFLLLSYSSLSAQCALICNSSIDVVLDVNGEAAISPPLLLQSSVGCSNDYSITIVDTLGNQVGTILDASLLGMPLTATLLHPESGNSCDVQISLTDDMAPSIDCGDSLFIWCNEPSVPDSLGYPVVSDNASETDSIEVVYSDTFTDLPCYDTVGTEVVTAYIKRVWTATDESGNVSTCDQHIYLKRATLPQIIFPEHRDGVQAPELECGSDDPGDLSVAGQPMVEGYPLDIAGSCELLTSYNDQEVPICGGSRKIIRTWTVFDLCTEDYRVYAQVIKLIDTTPPVITCPDNVSFNTYSTSCTAQVWLPQGAASDACSGETITTSWDYGTGYGPFNNVPAGVHTVTYTAKDGCNNTSSCQITVTVNDNKKPTALCELNVQVSLEEDGTALIFAESFDNGSYDNCSIAEYLVSRNGDPYDTFVSFECSDLTGNQQVTLKVVDENGLSNSCSSTAIVIDQIPPEIVCPPAVSINCGSNYNDTSLTGQPYASDNCSVSSVNFTDVVDLNNCGNGTVTRTWKATDQSNNQILCEQVITVSDETDITVVFPEDVDMYECQPDLDPSLTGEPLVTGQDCEQLQITHTDYYFYTAEPACFQLIRNWAIVDWCSYQPNNPGAGGFWEHTQVIEVRDSVAPVLSCPSDFTVGINGSSCQTYVNVPLPGIDDCSEQLTITNSSPFAQSNQGAASGTYPRGLHNITYTVKDGCGNTSLCSFRINVTDSEAPNPVCNNGVSVTIQQNGYVTLMPSMINNGSYDNCTNQSSLVLQVSPNTFTCQDIGTKVVTLTVTDQSGNSAFCQTNVVVQDNFNVCGNGTVGTIAGKLETETGEALSLKLIGLTGGINMAVQTDVDGTFDFPSLPLNQSYTLTPSYNTHPLNGVTTYDMVIIRRHILGVEQLDSPYKIIAADANKSGTVTTFDLVEIRKLVLNITTKFPNNKSWRFVDASYVFPNPANPFQAAFPEVISIPNLSGNVWEQDFIGIKVGDVNLSADPSDFTGGSSDERSTADLLIMTTPEIELAAGEDYAIPFVASSARLLAGFQFTIEFDETILEFRRMENGQVPSLTENNFGNNHAQAGFLTVSWENLTDYTFEKGDVFFTLHFKAKSSTRLSSEVIAINSRLTTAEAYEGSFYSADSRPGLLGVGLKVEGAPSRKGMALSANSPNPFYRQTTVHFYLPEAMEAQLHIYDVYGNRLQSYTGFYEAGDHEQLIDLSDFPYTGLLFCHLTAKGYQQQTLKMVMRE